MYSANEVMQDVAFGFMIEACRREIYSCADINQMRMLTLKTLELMENQRAVLRQMINEHQLDENPSRTALPVDQSGGQDH